MLWLGAETFFLVLKDCLRGYCREKRTNFIQSYIVGEEVAGNKDRRVHVLRLYHLKSSSRFYSLSYRNQLIQIVGGEADLFHYSEVTSLDLALFEKFDC